MHKPVRYYITESDDQPVVRSVQIATRIEPQIEPPEVSQDEAALPSRRRLTSISLTRKLKSHRVALPRS